MPQVIYQGRAGTEYQIGLRGKRWVFPAGVPVIVAEDVAAFCEGKNPKYGRGKQLFVVVRPEKLPEPVQKLPENLISEAEIRSKEKTEKTKINSISTETANAAEETKPNSDNYLRKTSSTKLKQKKENDLNMTEPSQEKFSVWPSTWIPR